MHGYPTHTEIVLRLLDTVLGERFPTRAEKISAFRKIEQAAKRMADGIERQDRDQARRDTERPVPAPTTTPAQPEAQS